MGEQKRKDNAETLSSLRCAEEELFTTEDTESTEKEKVANSNCGWLRLTRGMEYTLLSMELAREIEMAEAEAKFCVAPASCRPGTLAARMPALPIVSAGARGACG